MWFVSCHVIQLSRTGHVCLFDFVCPLSFTEKLEVYHVF